MDGIKQRGLITQKQSLITKMRFWINMSISYHQGLGIMNEKNKQTQVFVAAGCSAVHWNKNSTDAVMLIFFKLENVPETSTNSFFPPIVFQKPLSPHLHASVHPDSSLHILSAS